MRTHRIVCDGGPLDGRRFEFTSDEALPWPVVVLAPPGVEPVRYMRMTPLRPLRPGDPWTYVPLPPAALQED